MASIGVPSGSSNVADRLTHADTPGLRDNGKQRAACRRTIVSDTPLA